MTVAEVVSTPDTTKGINDRRQNDTKPKHDLMTIFTGLLVLVGFATCGIMIWQNWLIKDSIVSAGEANDIAQTAVSTAQRAWIGPQEIRVVEDATNKNAVRFEVYYQNVGKEPAVNFWQKLDFFASKETVRQPDTGGTCEATKPETGGSLIAYPSESATYRAILTVNQLSDALGVTPKDYLALAKIIYVHGCFTYETYGQRHFSKFCFRVIPVKDKPYGEWPWTFCLSGNEGN